jgi:hypothetical protein
MRNQTVLMAGMQTEISKEREENKGFREKKVRI